MEYQLARLYLRYLNIVSLNGFQIFLNITDNQFGFKKKLGCSHVIYSVRNVIYHFISGGSTVNVCSIDLSKAFDKMSHCALYMKLINRNIPLNLLKIIESWFNTSLTCVRWGRHSSAFFKLTAGVRQGGVLSPKLFADLSQKINSRDLGCHMSLQCTSIFLYADDILLVSPSVHMRQEMLNCCETELMWLDMRINANKSACIRFGPRYDTDCFQIVTANGDIIEWANSVFRRLFCQWSVF